jgi:hypothetical protein
VVAEPCSFECLDSLIEKLAFLPEDDLVRCSVKVLERKFGRILIMDVGQGALEGLPARFEFVGILVDDGLRQLEHLLQAQRGIAGRGAADRTPVGYHGRRTLRIGRTLLGREAMAMVWSRRQP